MVDAAERPMTLIRCPAGRAGEMLLPEARQRHVRPARQAYPDRGEGRRDRGLSLLRRHPRAARLRADGDDRIPRLGQQGRQGRISRPAGVRPRPRRRARFRQGEGSGACGCASCSQDLGLESFPLLTGGKGIHVVVPLDASADWPTVKSFADRFSRAIAEAEPETVHRQHPQGPAQGPDLPRLAAQPARSDRGHALFGARPRRRAGRRADRLGGARPIRRAATISASATPTSCSTRAGSKLLAGWGKAKQALPDA